MTSIAEIEGVARAERLNRYLHVGAPQGTTSNKVCVYVDGERWLVVITDERAGVIESSRRTFSSEAEAVAEALDSARMLRSLFV